MNVMQAAMVKAQIVTKDELDAKEAAAKAKAKAERERKIADGRAERELCQAFLDSEDGKREFRRLAREIVQPHVQEVADRKLGKAIGFMEESVRDAFVEGMVAFQIEELLEEMLSRK